MGCSINSTSVDPNGSRGFEIDTTVNFTLSCQGTGAGAAVQTLANVTVTATSPSTNVAPPRSATPAPVSDCPAGEICYTPLEPLPGVDESGGSQSLSSILNFAFRTLFTIGGLLAVFFLILGGIAYMTSEIANKKDEAKKRIRGALLGLGLLIVSYLILNTINPELLQFNIGVFTPSQLVPPSSTNAPATFTTTNSLQQFINSCVASGRHSVAVKDDSGKTQHICQ
jgi:hypothetical protein